ncbi:hypothetical protein GFM72_21095 [Salmonella enterica]|nr:hypothetical protein [Salmonella enterica]
MNATAKAPALNEIAGSAFNQKVKDVVGGISNGEKALVSLLSVACIRWFTTDKGGCDVINNYVNALSDFPRKQNNAIKVFAKLLPFVVITKDDEGKATTEAEIKLSAIEETKRKEQLALIEAFASLSYPSLAAAVKPTGEREKPAFKLDSKVKSFKNKASALVIEAIKNGVTTDKNAVIDELISSLTALKTSIDFAKEVEALLTPPESQSEPEKQAA